MTTQNNSTGKDRPVFTNGTLNLYLDYVEDTETPRIMHTWSLIAAAGACLGRRVYFDFGISQIFANHYVLLVGPPATKKSTAINIVEKLLRKHTCVRFAPSDTSGQRQGLLSAMVGEDENEDEAAVKAEMERVGANTFDEIPFDDLKNIRLALNSDLRDRHVLLAAASEFNSFIGNKASDLLTFLIKAWDGESYDYRLKNQQMVLDDPLLSILGGTTPTNIAQALPPEAIGQGFMSRVLLVFGNKKYKNVPRPKKLDDDIGEVLGKVLNWISYEADGPMQETAEAQEYLDSMYGQSSAVIDARFVFYAERRQAHIIKTAMCLAALRRSMVITKEDYQEANAILTATEYYMPEALGEFGLSPLAASKQKLMEFLMHADEPISTNVLWTIMHREMKLTDFQSALMDLCNAGKVMQVTTTNGMAYTYRQQTGEVSLQRLLVDLAEEDL